MIFSPVVVVSTRSRSTDSTDWMACELTGILNCGEAPSADTALIKRGSAPGWLGAVLLAAAVGVDWVFGMVNRLQWV